MHKTIPTRCHICCTNTTAESTTPEPQELEEPADTRPFPPFSCVNDKLPDECGSACPLTCDNYQNPPVCDNSVCVRGCFCPGGMVEANDGFCVSPEVCPSELL